MLRRDVYFFTATILEWQKLLKPDKYKQLIMDSLRFLVENKRIYLYGFVIMPNHIHLLWRMQEGHDERDVQRDFLKFTAQQIKFDLIANHPKVLPFFKVEEKSRQYRFWESKPYISTMYKKEVFEQKLNYIHNNPLQEKWQLVSKAEDYHFSSARFYLQNTDNWGFITHYQKHCEELGWEKKK
jgi:putative transposase